MKADMVDVVYVVGADKANEWFFASPDLYLKDGEPYGLIAYVQQTGAVYVASTTIEPSNPFTFGMLRDIMRLGKDETIVIATDDVDYFKHIQKVLGKHGYTFGIKNGILYSRKDK